MLQAVDHVIMYLNIAFTVFLRAKGELIVVRYTYCVDTTTK